MQFDRVWPFIIVLTHMIGSQPAEKENPSYIPIIIGGVISLISVILGLVIQHFFQMRKMIHESKSYPSKVLYDKQIEFLDALPPILDQFNSYITTIDVWLGEKGEKAKVEVQKAAQNNSCLSQLDHLLHSYQFYLPSKLLNTIHTLSGECWLLHISPDTEKTYRCINLLFEIENNVRVYIGVDRLSEDLMRAMGRKKDSQNSDKPEIENN